MSLVVFDLLGRQLKTLVDEYQEAVYKTVKWDGIPLGSGVYFYRFQAYNFNKEM